MECLFGDHAIGVYASPVSYPVIILSKMEVIYQKISRSFKTDVMIEKF